MTLRCSLQSIRGTAFWPVMWVLLLGTSACQHAPQRRGSASAEQRLLDLEQSFSRFVSVTLDENELPPLGRFEVQRKKLEWLRMRYLDVVRDAPSEGIRIAAMVRVAELHLDLAARVRRMPYEKSASSKERQEFDAQLSRWALPLEATGLGILHQISLDDAEHRHADVYRWQMASSSVVGSSKSTKAFSARANSLPSVTAWRERVALYLALHDVTGEEGEFLSEEERGQLVRLLGEHGPYGAPRRLLDMGRLGQRSARR